MSLINKMLQDLERREPSMQPMQRLESDPIPEYAETAPYAASWMRQNEEPERNHTALLAGLGLAALLIVGGGAWWLGRESAPQALATSQDAPAEEVLPQVPAIEFVPDPKAEVPELPEPVPAPAPKPVQAEKPVVKTAMVPPAKSEPAPKAVTPAAPATTPATAVAQAKPPIAAAALVAPAIPRAEQLFQQAQAELRQGQTDAALNTLRASLEADPKHVQARLGLARLLIERKQLPAAADLLADGVMLQPQQPAFVLALAPLWFQSGQQDDALALLSQGAKQSSATPQLHGYYAGQLLRLKRHADSAVEFRAALRSDPVQADWLIGLGLALQGAGQNKEAIEALRRAYETGKLSPERKDLVEQMIAGLKSKG